MDITRPFLYDFDIRPHQNDQLVETSRMVLKTKLYHIFLSFQFLTIFSPRPYKSSIAHMIPKPPLGCWYISRLSPSTQSSKSCFQNRKAWTPLRGVGSPLKILKTWIRDYSGLPNKSTQSAYVLAEFGDPRSLGAHVVATPIFLPKVAQKSKIIFNLL